MQQAQAEFERLGMTATRERNGVLIFIAPRSRNFAIVGDQGVHTRCGQGFWSSVAAAMEQDFRNELMTDAIILGIAKAGELLSKHFPRKADDVNELSDTIERG